MQTLTISLAAIAILIFLRLILKTVLRSKSYKYQKRQWLLSKNELSFYKILRQTEAAKKFHIFVKVRLADLIEPQKGIGNWQASFNKICAKHIDFILCDTINLKPVLAIELDDSSHDRPDRKERDTFIDNALKSAGLPILHTRSTDKLEAKITAALQKK